MTPEPAHSPHLLVFRGREVFAQYNPEQISIYRDNPLIEALPPLLTEEQAFISLSLLPRYDAQERLLPNHERLHLIQEVLQFFQPLPVHIDLEQRFARLIRSGYRARNPASREFFHDISQKVEALVTNQVPPSRLRSTANGFTIIGMSGVGKTTAVESVLQLYPQVINHSYYRNRDFTLRQIVWLKLDCPFDGSIKGLCLNFFQAVDDLLDTSYYQHYAGKGRRTVDELIPAMARVASLHCLGVLVIDELQNLSEAKSGGHKKMLNFFVGLINTIGLPVVLVGTYKAWSVLSGEFRQMRRGTGQGDLLWHPMPENDTWQFFIESLWRYQYTLYPCPLNPQLAHTLYYETQGITDFAIKVYMLAQIRAITTGKEKVTEAIIRSVAKDCLCLAAPVLSALKRGDKVELQKFEDVYLVDIEPYFQEAAEKLTLQVINGSVKENTPNESTIANSQADSCPKKPPHAKPSTSFGSQSVKPDESGLPEIVASGVKQKVGAYESLQRAGFIKAATEYLFEDISG
ncbi:ATP-binding protein [Nostoc sp. ChiVER01]|uniref:ATP-binding protein n=1 Tax=Nostoc sp. ChiVER01 TaxID=3075382 RepID=UPI002AD41AF0|nr:ATP-binding protein [Nostoc sp. ChiVER01]MDZ8226938.1 ATP-binding protein [Nostoc sp. ChiVER01]